MVKTHKVNYLRAYNMENRLLSPNLYSSDLPGTIVCVAFVMKRWVITDKEKDVSNDVFAADIQTIHILAAAPVEDTPATTSKRKFEMCEPMPSSPKKMKKSTA
jgi:hypothetical protein